MSGPQLSVVLSTLGSHATLERVLDGYAAQAAPPGSFEVLVVADAAEPDVAAVERAIARRPFPVRLVRGSRPGLSANRNAGRRAASAPLVLFTDNDTIPVPRLVVEHLGWHARFPDERDAVLGHVRWAPELRVTPFMRWLDTGIQFDFANIKGIDAGWGFFAGANVSLKRAFVERVGDFDEEHLPYGYEDVDWAYRADAEGMRLRYARRAVVDHLRPVTLEFWTRRVRRLAAAEYAFTRKHAELEPFFRKHFGLAAAQPPIRGRGRHLTRFVPRRTPRIGRRVWSSADVYYKQQLAPHFLEAWAEAERRGEPTGQPDVSEWAPSGPK